MSVDENQKKAILDVINLLKTSFEIKDDDHMVISEKFTDRERSINEQSQELQRKEREFRQNITLKTQQIRQEQNELRKKQVELNKQFSDFAQKMDALSSQERSMSQRQESVKTKELQLQNKETQLISDLEKLASMSKDDAVELLCNKIQNEAKLRSENRIKEIINETNQTALVESQRILAYTIQKESTNAVSALSASSVDLPDDALKGKIIGREGRNIKTFEELTGVTVLVDDTPEMIVLSSYDPIRREIAKNAMVKLIADGRIHPQRIEEIVTQCTKEFDEHIMNIGHGLATEFRIADLRIDILRTLGKLKYRTSYTQNVLDHSKEVALIASDIAAEIKLDSKLLLRAGLLHDIGKALDRNLAGTHAELGANYLRQNGESDKICKLVAEHHDNEPQSILTWIIKTADTISSARPGARLDAVDTYVKRLQDLEQIAKSFDGIKTSYAILAGRELRVAVEPDRISDVEAASIAEQIKTKIQNSMTYPGQIKVIVVREMRHIQIA
jgi:ribonucrease Y